MPSVRASSCEKKAHERNSDECNFAHSCACQPHARKLHDKTKLTTRRSCCCCVHGAWLSNTSGSDVWFARTCRAALATNAPPLPSECSRRSAALATEKLRGPVGGKMGVAGLRSRAERVLAAPRPRSSAFRPLSPRRAGCRCSQRRACDRQRNRPHSGPWVPLPRRLWVGLRDGCLSPPTRRPALLAGHWRASVWRRAAAGAPPEAAPARDLRGYGSGAMSSGVPTSLAAASEFLARSAARCFCGRARTSRARPAAVIRPCRGAARAPRLHPPLKCVSHCPSTPLAVPQTGARLWNGFGPRSPACRETGRTPKAPTCRAAGDEARAPRPATSVPARTGRLGQRPRPLSGADATAQGLAT